MPETELRGPAKLLAYGFIVLLLLAGLGLVLILLTWLGSLVA